MNEKEKIGCSEILHTLPTEELYSLTDTVTKKLIKVSSSAEAVSAILTYSESACELLSRRKLKRDILFKYLVDKGIVTSINSDKKTIIQKLLEAWGTQNIGDVMKRYNVETLSSSASQEFSPAPAIQQNVICQQNDTALWNSSGSGDTSQVLCRDQPDLRLLGETFATWFYKVLNSHNPHMGVNPEEFGPCHFWDEAKLMLVTITSVQNSKDDFHGSELVAEKLLSFTKSEQILFNPNISQEGILVKGERHGLVVVVVCGTIHRQNQHLGVFDQMFGLVKDPRFDNNWKIKLTKLKLQNIEVDHVPSIKEKPESEIRDLVAV